MLVALDIGNAVSLAYQGSTMYTIPSLFTPVAGLLNRRAGELFLIHDGRNYHLGADARRYAQYFSLLTQDKEERVYEASLLAYPLLVEIVKDTKETTFDVVLQFPDQYSGYHTQLCNHLNRSHVFTLDDIEYNIRLRVVGQYQEGFGSWVMNNQQPNGTSLVIDIGGGTTVASLIDNDTGEVYAVANYQGSGIVKLFSLLRDDIEFRHEFGGLVLDYSTMARYVEEGNPKIFPHIDRHVKSWWKNIFQGRITRDFSTQIKQGEINQIIMTGGGSLFIKPMIEAAQAKGGVGSLFMMAQDPLYDNIVGIYEWKTEPNINTSIPVGRAKEEVR